MSGRPTKAECIQARRNMHRAAKECRKVYQRAYPVGSRVMLIQKGRGSKRREIPCTVRGFFGLLHHFHLEDDAGESYLVRIDSLGRRLPGGDA